MQRRLIEIRAAEILDRDERKWRHELDVERLQEAPARSTQLQPSPWLRAIGDDGAELSVGGTAVDAPLGGAAPRGRAERAAEQPLAVEELRQRRPRAAGGTIP